MFHLIKELKIKLSVELLVMEKKVRVDLLFYILMIKVYRKLKRIGMIKKNKD